MHYRLPEPEDRERVQDYLREHIEHQEYSLSAGMGLESMAYSDWAAQIRKNASEPDGEWGRSLTLLCMDGDRLIGLLNVRHELSEDARNVYGDIGYGVRPGARNKGYATQMLKHGLEICREKGMKDVIIGCFRDNAASDRVIQKNGGELAREDDSYQKGRLSRYYTIRL